MSGWAKVNVETIIPTRAANVTFHPGVETYQGRLACDFTIMADSHDPKVNVEIVLDREKAAELLPILAEFVREACLIPNEVCLCKARSQRA